MRDKFFRFRPRLCFCLDASNFDAHLPTIAGTQPSSKRLLVKLLQGFTFGLIGCRNGRYDWQQIQAPETITFREVTQT